MPPSILLSPTELSYLHTSLSLDPPIRPDGRSSTSFRPLVAETDFLPTTNGSARLCFADGTEAIVGVKAEVERTAGATNTTSRSHSYSRGRDEDTKMHSAEEDIEEERIQQAKGKGQDSWIEVTVDLPGLGRDDDGVVVFLAQMLQEGLVADGGLRDRLWIGWGWHWKIYVDVGTIKKPSLPAPRRSRKGILLLTAPNSYPLPLLSLTMHLALLSTRLPAPVSRIDEDPLFNDDWDAARSLYETPNSTQGSRPPFTLLVVSVGDNIFFDPSREELSVADAVCAITVGTLQEPQSRGESREGRPNLRLLSLRTIDPPARLAAAASAAEGEDDHGLWKPARGGMKRAIVGKMVKMVLEPGGVGEEASRTTCSGYPHNQVISLAERWFLKSISQALQLPLIALIGSSPITILRWFSKTSAIEDYTLLNPGDPTDSRPKSFDWNNQVCDLEQVTFLLLEMRSNAHGGSATCSISRMSGTTSINQSQSVGIARQM
ncbi:MAG: hypothetical protein Q9184_001566 [Pyrenodesmia sp. 2 TL-2023]